MTFNGFVTHMDLAQVTLWIFWGFFAGLIFYLHRENKREGYPLMADKGDRSYGSIVGFPGLPTPKTYLLANGGTFTTPNDKVDMREIKAEPIGNWPGAPLEPTGNPMLDAVGPASYAERADAPDVTSEGGPRLVPLRNAPAFGVNSRDPDPRGMRVIGTDRSVGGVVTDAWVDLSEYVFRYFELEVEDGRHVLLPVPFCVIDGARREIRVKAITGPQFAQVPGLKSPDQVTLLEEDKICGYYGGGYLYATAARAEPML